MPDRVSRVRATGVVVRGHRVASGACGDPRFPDGTIAPQLPLFEAHVPGFTAYLGGVAHPGTINVAFRDWRPRILAPHHHLRAIKWTDAFPPEDFLLSRCTIALAGTAYPAFAYCPDPATKPDHHQPTDVVELLARRIPGLAYGAEIQLAFAPGTMEFVPAPLSYG